MRGKAGLQKNGVSGILAIYTSFASRTVVQGAKIE